MNTHWNYHERSQKALCNLKSLTEEKQTKFDSGVLSRSEIQLIFLELYNKGVTPNAEISSTFQSNAVEHILVSNESEENMDVEQTEINNVLSRITPDQEQKQLNELMLQFLDQFKVDCAINTIYFENTLSGVSNVRKLYSLIVVSISGNSVLNVCKAFNRTENTFFSNHCQDFLVNFLLPCIVCSKSVKEMRLCIVECFERMEDKVFSFVILPILLKNEPSNSVNITFVSTLSAQQQKRLLNEYLSNFIDLSDWVFPILLFIYSSLDAESSYKLLSLVINFLSKGSINYDDNKNFSKILHSVITNLSKREVLSEDDYYYFCKLKNIALENTTVFKKSCLNIINNIEKVHGKTFERNFSRLL